MTMSKLFQFAITKINGCQFLFFTSNHIIFFNNINLDSHVGPNIVSFALQKNVCTQIHIFNIRIYIRKLFSQHHILLCILIDKLYSLQNIVNIKKNQ